MIIFEKGYGGAGNKLKIDIDEILNYGISIFDFQKLLCRTNIPRKDLGQEKRVWITYKGDPIVEISVDEIKAVIYMPLNFYRDSFEEDTVIGIKAFIQEHQKEVQQLLS